MAKKKVQVSRLLRDFRFTPTSGVNPEKYRASGSRNTEIELFTKPLSKVLSYWKPSSPQK